MNHRSGRRGVCRCHDCKADRETRARLERRLSSAELVAVIERTTPAEWERFAAERGVSVELVRERFGRFIGKPLP